VTRPERDDVHLHVHDIGGGLDGQWVNGDDSAWGEQHGGVTVKKR
jgi:hypothetical protein